MSIVAVMPEAGSANMNCVFCAETPVIVEPAPAGAAIELFYSMRSPYSYLALDRSVALARRHGVPVEGPYKPEHYRY